jgi:KDO2-lipid IV(A) lauroyltransferase
MQGPRIRSGRSADGPAALAMPSANPREVPGRERFVQRNRVVDYTVYLIVRILICIVLAVHIETGQSWAKRLGWLFARVLRIRGKVVDENLRHAFPDLSDRQRRQLTQRMWEHLFLLVLEVAHAPRKIHETNWRQYVELHRIDEAVRLLLADRPTVVVTAHFGNFEIGGFMLGMLGYPTFTVARALDNPYLDRFVSQFRGATGQYIIAKNGEFDKILAVLESGGTMSFLADQYAGPKGCWVEFFHRTASAHKAIALLSMENDAPIIVCGARRTGRPLHFVMEVIATADPRDAKDNVGSVRDLTQWYTQQIETMIRRAPEQYWWIHRRWKDTRPPRRAHAVKAA